MNKIWICFLLIGLIASFFLSTTNDVVLSINNLGENTLKVFLKLSFLMLFWGGMFNILKKANIIKLLTKIFQKPVSSIFKNIDTSSECFELIVTNLVANMLGIGSCATLVGIKVVKELDNLNLKSDLIKFILLNISTLCIFPSTIIGIRMSYNAKQEIYLLYILVSIFSFAITLLINKIINPGEK